MTQNATPPVPGSPEHDAAMIALAERSGSKVTLSDTDGTSTEVNLAAAAPAEPTDETPPQGDALILGKFKSQADLEAAYKALEAKLGQPKAPVADPAKPATPAPQGDPAAAPQGIQAVFDKAAAEYAESKQFSAETVAALEAAGVPRAMADNYIAGLDAQARLVESEVYGAAGGQEQYATMQSWAADNLSAEQIEAFNMAVGSGDLGVTKGAIANLKALYAAANGTDPATRIERQGGSGNEPVADMYRSKAEVMKDMNDPRYKAGDRAFHALVDRRLSAAMTAGIDVGF